MTVPGLDLLAHVGVAVCERAGPGKVRLVGRPPLWWARLAPAEDLVAEELQWADALAFLGHFLAQAEEAWSEGGDRRLRSGVWAEDGPGGPEYFEAEALSFQGRKLLLIHSLAERGREVESMMQAARDQALAADSEARAQAALQEQLLRAKERAEALSDAKSTLLANVSHEIRTPVSGVMGLAELLLRSSPREDQVELLRLVEQSAGSLLEIINDLLDLSKIEVGKVELLPEPLDLRSLLANTLGPIAVRAHAKGVELNYRVDSSVPRSLSCDGLRLRQVLVNLVGNAIKFTDRGEVAVFVDAPPTLDGQSRIRISVQDTGPGIPEEGQRRIFEAFTQADATVARTHGGTGLGLTISARLVALMGGHLSVRSVVGEGSDFHFELPLNEVDPPDTALGPPARVPERALVVDDCTTSASAAVSILQTWGCRVDRVETPAEASELLERALAGGDPYDLLLASAGLPDVVDVEWARGVAERFADSDLKTVLAFSTEQRDPLLKWRSAGVGSHLLKPIGEARLAAALEDPEVVSGAETGDSRWAGLGAGRKVLVADDNAVNRLLVGALLHEAAYATTAVADGLEAVQRVGAEDFDVVLMDVHMPRLDGLEATRAIRAAEAGTGRRLPIIALTADTDESDRQKCLAVGMDGYVTKPIDPSRLFEALNTSLITDPKS